MNDQPADRPPKDKSPEDWESKADEAASVSIPPKAEEFRTIINNLPPEQVRHALSEFFFAVVDRGGTPKTDPEVFKIAAATVEKDNDNKFRYLTQKEENAAARSLREHEFRVRQHTDRFGMLRPIILTAVIVFTVCLFTGIYLAATGHEILGSCILTGAIASILSYLAGLGTADLLKGQPKDR